MQDKTFGLKNKKGKKQQEYIRHVTQQVKYGNQSMAKVVQAELQTKVTHTHTTHTHTHIHIHILEAM